MATVEILPLSLSTLLTLCPENSEMNMSPNESAHALIGVLMEAEVASLPSPAELSVPLPATEVMTDRVAR
jgi:hypothetical protein